MYKLEKIKKSIKQLLDLVVYVNQPLVNITEKSEIWSDHEVQFALANRVSHSSTSCTAVQPQ